MEAILGVKEHAERARKAAFELLVVMGGRMREGGTIRMGLLNDTGNANATSNAAEGGEEREANMEEFVKMLGASLAADRDHTISAGVMSLSRVLFEFKGRSSLILSPQLRLHGFLFPITNTVPFSAIFSFW